MKVKDLIEKLQTLDQDLEVKVCTGYPNFIEPVEAIKKKDSRHINDSKPYYLLT